MPNITFLNINQRFTLGISLNVIFIVIEILYGFKADSMALIADAIHNLGDILGLLIAWAGMCVAKAKSPEKFTFGFKNATIFSTLINAMILLISIGAISIEAIQRLNTPAVVASQIVMVVATVGVIINGLTALLFFEGSKEDINIQGAFLHMMADAGISFGVILSALLMMWTQQFWFDPVFSLIIVVFIFLGCWGNLKESIILMLHAVPKHIHLPEIKQFFSSQEEVISFHDLHIWAISTTETALAMHVVLKENCLPGPWIIKTNAVLNQQFRIQHTTLQVDNLSPSTTCTMTCKES